MIAKLQTYVMQSIAEIRKVVWPTKEQTINYTLLVIAMSIGVALFFGILDYVFNLGLEQLIK